MTKRKRNVARRKISIPIGKLCDSCGTNLAVHRHHEDYNKPLDVKLLCLRCHGLTRVKTGLE